MHPLCLVWESQRDRRNCLFCFTARLIINQLTLKAMKSHQKIELTPATVFNLSKDENERLYTALALFQYPYRSIPDYKQQVLLRRLRNDFERFNRELIQLSENDPNNLIISKMRTFFQKHYSCIKKVVKECDGANSTQSRLAGC